MEAIKKILTALGDIIKRVRDILRYPVQFIVYLINTTNWFTKTSKERTVKFETFYILMIIATVMGAYAVGSDVAKGLEYSSFHSWMLVPFCTLAAIRVLSSLFLGVVPKSIQDHFWRTQLFNFTNPKHAIQFDKYPDAEQRLKELKDKWIEHKGETIETTKANAPWQQNAFFQVSIIVVLGLVALGLGNLFN